MARLAGGKPIPLPKGEAGRIAAALIKQFKPCNNGVVPDFAHTTSRPVYRNKPVGVSVRLTDNIPVDAPPHRRHVVSGSFNPFSPQGQRAGLVIVNVAESCRPKAAWNADMRSVIQHELAHAADQVVHARYAHAIQAQAPQNDQRKRARVDFCGYVNEPIEITARIAQVAHELSTTTARAAVRQRVDYAHPSDPARAHEILYKSSTYNAVENCLTPKNKRKFLQLAARLWRSGRYGELPSAGQPIRQLPPPKFPRDRRRR